MLVVLVRRLAHLFQLFRCRMDDLPNSRPVQEWRDNIQMGNSLYCPSWTNGQNKLKSARRFSDPLLNYSTLVKF